MFKASTIERLKEYSNAHRPVSMIDVYENNGALSAENVFEPGNDIFINLHTFTENSSKPSLHGHDFFELNYVIQGFCTQHLFNNEPIELVDNSICIMNPNARHNLRVNSEKDLVLNISLKRSLFTTTFFSLIEQHEYIGQFFLSYFLSLDRTSDYLLFYVESKEKISDMMEKSGKQN